MLFCYVTESIKCLTKWLQNGTHGEHGKVVPLLVGADKGIGQEHVLTMDCALETIGKWKLATLNHVQVRIDQGSTQRVCVTLRF